MLPDDSAIRRAEPGCDSASNTTGARLLPTSSACTVLRPSSLPSVSVEAAWPAVSVMTTVWDIEPLPATTLKLTCAPITGWSSSVTATTNGAASWAPAAPLWPSPETAEIERAPTRASVVSPASGSFPGGELTLPHEASSASAMMSKPFHMSSPGMTIAVRISPLAERD
jgi:hypothetical protein